MRLFARCVSLYLFGLAVASCAAGAVKDTESWMPVIALALSSGFVTFAWSAKEDS